MAFRIERQGEVLRIHLQGRMDKEEAQALEHQWRQLEFDGVSSVAFDLSSAASLSSTAIGKLLAFNREAEKRGIRVCLEQVPPEIYQVLRMVRLHEVLPIQCR